MNTQLNSCCRGGRGGNLLSAFDLGNDVSGQVMFLNNANETDNWSDYQVDLPCNYYN